MKQGNELQQATPISTNLVKIKHRKNSGNKSETYAGSWHGWSAILLLVWNGHEILNRSKPLPQGPAEIEGVGMVAVEHWCLTTYLTGCVCRFVKETLRLCNAYSILIEFWSRISIFLESSRKSLREGGIFAVCEIWSCAKLSNGDRWKLLWYVCFAYPNAYRQVVAQNLSEETAFC